MKFWFSILIASIIFILPFFIGFFDGRQLHSKIDYYQEKTDLTKEETKIVIKLNYTREKIENTTKKWEEEKEEVEKEHTEEETKKIITFSTFKHNLRRATIGMISMGIMFIPIAFETGRIVGYYMAEITINWTILFLLEASSYILFCASIYNLLLGSFSMKNHKKTMKFFCLMFIVALILLLVSAYFEVFV